MIHAVLHFIYALRIYNQNGSPGRHKDAMKICEINININ